MISTCRPGYLRRERGRHLWQEGDERRSVGRDAHPPSAQSDMGVELCGRRIHAPEDLRRPLGEHPARLGQTDAAPHPLDQLCPGLRLQPGDVVADRGLRVVQLAGGGSHRSVAGDRREHTEPIEVEHSSTVSMSWHHNKH